MEKKRNFPIVLIIAVLLSTLILGIFNFPKIKPEIAHATGDTITFAGPVTVNDLYTWGYTVAKLTETKIAVAYVDNGGPPNSSVTVVIGDITGDSISWGTPVHISNSNQYPSITALSSNKIVVAYQIPDYGKGNACIGDVSGNSVTFGDSYQFQSGTANVQSTDLITVDSSKFVLTYQYGDGLGRAIVGTVSGTGISYGETAVFNSGRGTQQPSIAKLDSNKFVIAFMDYYGSDWNGAAIIGTVSDTSISYGAKSQFRNLYIYNQQIVALSSSSIVVTYVNFSGSDMYFGRAIAATISGDTFSWGSEAIFNAANTAEGGLSLIANSSDRATLSYYNNGDKSYAISVGVSGTELSFGPTAEFNGGLVWSAGSTFLNASKFIIVYDDGTIDHHGRARIGSYEAPSENLSDTVTSLTVDAPADHKITLSSPNGSGSASDNLTITFPPEFTTYDYSKFKTNMFASLFLGTAHAAGGLDYTDVDLSHGPTTGYETEETIAAAPSDTAWGADFAGNVLTLTHPTNPANGNIQAGDKVIVEIGTIAGGTHQIGNPSVAGQYIVRIEGTFVNNINAALDIKLSDQVQVTGAVDPSISYAISNNSVVFGGITQATVKYATPSGSGSLTPPDNGAFQLTDINTNAANGLSIKAQSNGDGSANAGFYNSALTELIPASSITSIVAGTDGYALCTKNGTNTVSPTSEFTCESGSQAITRSPQEIANTTAPVANGTVDVDLKAAIDATTPAGSYADTITVIVTGNF